MIKLVSLFLIAMGAMALFGRFRIPGVRRYCPRCGRKLGWDGRCDCGAKRRRG